MKNFLGEKMLLDARHGRDCVLEVCTAGEPDNDTLLMKGTAGDCLRKIMSHELDYSGDQYFCLYTDQGSFDGIAFDVVSRRMGYDPEELRDVLSRKPSIGEQIQSASTKAADLERSAEIPVISPGKGR